MAKIENILDGGKGKLGNLVFYKMNGSSYVRTRPAKYRDRKSPAQLAQRQRMQVVISFLRSFRDLVRVTFAAEATGRTALQAAQSYNMRHALAGEYPDIRIDKSKVLLSRGPLPLPAGVSVTAQPEGLLIRWENGPEATGSAANDTLVVMALPGDTGNGIHDFTSVRRSEGEYLWRLPQPVQANNLEGVWMAFRNLKLTSMSDSIWINR